MTVLSSLTAGSRGQPITSAEHFLIARATHRGEEGQGPSILNLVRKAQLVLFPVIGLIVGAMLAKNSGVL